MLPLTTLSESWYQSAGRGAEHSGDNHILYRLEGLRKRQLRSGFTTGDGVDGQVWGEERMFSRRQSEIPKHLI